PLPLINMAVGIPDGETPKGILDCFAEAIRKPENQKYVAFHGKKTFKQAIVDFYQRQFGVEQDKENEVCILYVKKIRLLDLPSCIVNIGENVFMPDPVYTYYLSGVQLSCAQPQPLVLTHYYYLPQWHNVDTDILLNTRLVYLTYPYNPPASVATK